MHSDNKPYFLIVGFESLNQRIFAIDLHICLNDLFICFFIRLNELLICLNDLFICLNELVISTILCIVLRFSFLESLLCHS